MRRALAVDIASGPLARARSASAHLRDRIEVRQSDGLLALRPGEVTCISIAGMGGLTVAKILTEGATVCAAASRIVVQPQGMEAEVRTVLLAMGVVDACTVSSKTVVTYTSLSPGNPAVSAWSGLQMTSAGASSSARTMIRSTQPG